MTILELAKLEAEYFAACWTIHNKDNQEDNHPIIKEIDKLLTLFYKKFK